MLTLDFIRAGKAIFTIELSPEFAATHKIPPHYTFKVSHQPAENGYRECWFVSLLTGPENTSDYTYVGLLADDNTLRLTQKSKFRPDRPLSETNRDNRADSILRSTKFLKSLRGGVLLLWVF